MRINLLLGLATACLFFPLTLPVNAEDNTKQSDNNTRLYVEAYGFFPLETHSKTTLNNNITSETLNLNDVLDMLTGVFSSKVLLKKGASAYKPGLTISASAPRRWSRPGRAPIPFEMNATLDFRNEGSTLQGASSQLPTQSKPCLILRFVTAAVRFKSQG
jgi:hypothetical protein